MVVFGLRGVKHRTDSWRNCACHLVFEILKTKGQIFKFGSWALKIYAQVLLVPLEI